MPWMGVGVYLPPAAAPSAVRAGFSAFEDLVDLFGALLRAAGFFAAARFFMSRTLPPACSVVNAPTDAVARRSVA